MTKSIVYFILLVLLDIVSVVIVDGSFLEIKGIIAFFIFAVTVFLNIVFLKKYSRIFQKVILSVMMLVYIMTGVVFLIREDSWRVIEQKKNGKYIYITYEINPGAMSHLSYMDNVYYSLIDTDLLTVRIVKSTKHHRYIG